MGQRPEPAECEDFNRPGGHAHGTPLLWEGRLQAGWRDATFVNCPDTHSIKARHIVVASHRYAVGGGIVAAAAACSPTRIAIDTGMLHDATDVHPNGRCQRPGCRQLFARALAEDEPSGPDDEMVTVRFHLHDTVLTAEHPDPRMFRHGTPVRYFAGYPIQWWPAEARLVPPAGDELAVELTFHHEGGAPGTWSALVDMRLPRAALARETQAPYTVLDETAAAADPA